MSVETLGTYGPTGAYLPYQDAASTATSIYLSVIKAGGTPKEALAAKQAAEANGDTRGT